MESYRASNERLKEVYGLDLTGYVPAGPRLSHAEKLEGQLRFERLVSDRLIDIMLLMQTEKRYKLL